MKPQKQRFLHNPPESYGDCFPTALASLMNIDRDDVPHFWDGGKEPEGGWYAPVREWLAKYNLTYLSLPVAADLKTTLGMMGDFNPGVFYLLSGNGGRVGNHTVVAKDDEIIWDPHPDNSGLVGPCEDGFYWIDFLLPANIHSG